MSLYLKLTQGVPAVYSLEQLRADNPNTSFPEIMPLGLLADYGVFEYTRPNVPSVDRMVERVVDGDFLQASDGAWQLAYQTEQLPTDEAEANVRGRRAGLLAECDWTQVDDAPVDKTVWAVYRQELRDIPDQSGFPYNVNWPAAPK